MKLNKLHVLIASIIFMVIGYFTSSSTIEIVSAVSGLLCVWLAAKENIWSYPIGFVNIGAFMYIFWGAGLYADFTLQIIFTILSVYGWVFWLTKKGDSTVRPTKRVSISEIFLYIIVAIVGTYLWANFNLRVFNGVALPYFDAFIAVLSVIAQVMLSRKRLENWYVWIIVDVLSIGMYWYKDLHLVSILYMFFLVNAVYGLIAWKKEFKRQYAIEVVNKIMKGLSVSSENIGNSMKKLDSTTMSTSTIKSSSHNHVGVHRKNSSGWQHRDYNVLDSNVVSYQNYVDNSNNNNDNNNCYDNSDSGSSSDSGGCDSGGGE